MAQANLSDYKNLYIESVRESIKSLREQCDKLTNNILDKEALNNLHIASHSLKGRSQVMGFVDIANICLNIEKMSDDALKGIVQLSNENILEIKRSVEEVSEILQKI